MAHRKAGGSAKNLRDSNPKYLGVKLADGQSAKVGSIILRQRGTKTMAGANVCIGKDHTLFALTPGTVKFSSTRKKHFDGSVKIKKVVSIITGEIKKIAPKKVEKKEVVKEEVNLPAGKAGKPVAKKTAAKKTETKKPTTKKKPAAKKAPTKKTPKKEA